MKQFTLTLIALFFFGLFTNGFSQEKSAPTVYTLMTFELQIPENGSQKRFGELMEQYHQKVVQKNEHIVSERIMRHLSGSNSKQLIILTEYASWNDINTAQNRNNELMKEAFPDDKERAAFNSELNTYLGSHSDEIYSDIKSMRK
jgi:hypothetical protein